jgi:hypothetical protein
MKRMFYYVYCAFLGILFIDVFRSLSFRFRLKYHPEDSVKRKEEQMAALKKRVEVFLELMNSGKLTVTVDCIKTGDLLKLLDTVVIKLEGGTDEDLAILEQEYTELEEKSKEQKKEEGSEKVNDDSAKKEQQEPEKPKCEEVETKENGESGDTAAEDGEIEQDKVEENPPPEENKEPEKMDVDDEKKEEPETNEPPKEKEAVEGEEEVKKNQKDKKRKRSFSGSSSGSSSSSSESEEEKDKKEKKEEEEDAEKDKQKEEVKEQIETVEDDKPEKPKSLHKTTSIFLRNLAPTITKQEVEAVCGRYEGFLRVALADPQPERRWLRRGWVTFKRDANIKEICWNLNNIRLRDCELGAIVNRDLSRRIRPINGITAHKQVVRSDIRISAKVALHLDNRSGLWLDEEKKEKPQQTFGLVSNNPVLHNITDYLIEEASAEEEELLGLEPTADAQDSASTVERDEHLISVLDRIILYLRVVHSVDYYNHCEYPNEDEMPNRCGILHARGPPPTTKTDMTQFIGAPIEAKMSSFLPEKPRDENKNETKLIHLSLKDVDTEIDKFVQANTRELAKDKWLCPLSGKKFKGPDFVRKHIFNKHAEKIEEVKKEVEFFNNYLRDPKRPMLAEAPQPKREEPPTYNHPSYGSSFGGYGRLPPYYNQGYSQRSRGYAPRSR